MSRRILTGRSSVVRKSVLTLAALAAAPMLMSDSAFGADLIWDNNGNVAPNPQDGAGTWDLSLLNWFNGTSNVAWNNANNDIAVLGAGGTAGDITLETSITVGGMDFNLAGYRLVTANNSSLTLNSAGASTFNVNATGSIAVAITGGGSAHFNVAPTATLFLGTGGNDYTGGTTLDGGGTVDIGTSNRFGTGSLTLGNITIVSTTGTPRLVPTQGQGTITVLENSTATFHIGQGTTSGVGFILGPTNTSPAPSISSTGNATLVFQGDPGLTGGTLTFAQNMGMNNFTGNILVRNLTVQLAGGNNSVNAVWDLGSNGTLQFRQTQTISIGGLTGLAGSVMQAGPTAGTINIGSANTNTTFAGVIQNGGATLQVIKSGTGQLLLTNVNTYTGNTMINGGTLALGAGASINATPNIFFNDGAALDVSAVVGGYSGPASLQGNGSIYGDVASSNVISPGVTATPVGSLNFNGNLALNGSEVRFDVGAGTNDVLNITGGLALNSGNFFITPFGSLESGTYTLATYNAASLSGSTSNFGLIFGQRAAGTIETVSTPGQLKLNITSVGATGVLDWNSTTDGTWNLSSAQNWFNTNTSQQDAFFSGDTVNFNDGTGLVTTIEKSGLLQPAAVNINADTLVYTIGGSGTISGAATVTKNGAGTAILSTANSFTGGTTINSGTLQVNNNTALGTGSVLLTAPGAALMMSGGITMANAINIAADDAVIGGNGTFNGAINTVATSILLSLPTTGTTSSFNAAAVFSNIVAGPISLTVTDSSAGVLRFTGTNTSFGAVDWDLADSSVSMVNRDGPRALPLGSLAGGPNTLLRGSTTAAGVTTYTIGGGAVTSTTFAGSILDGTGSGGTLALVKAGGTLTLSGANAYTGVTTINADGALIVNGSHSGGGAYAVTGTLGGSGVITAAVNVNGGTLSPGASVGALTVGALNLAGGSNINAEFGSAGGDGVIVTNDGGATAAATVTVHLSDLGGAIAGQYPLIDYSGAGPSASAFTTSGSVGAFTASIVDNAAGSSVDLVLTGAGPVHAMWNTTGNGDWTTAGNWTPSSPNGVDFQAYFGSINSSPAAVNVDSAKTVSRIHFNSANSYTLSGANAITLNSSSGSAGINVLRGSHTIAAPVTLSQATDVNVSPDSVLTISGNVGGTSGLTKQGQGDLVLNGTNTYEGTTTVSAGLLQLDGTHTGGGAYSVASGATLGGSGTTSSAVSLASGARLAPGASIGVLTVGGLSLDSSILAFEIGSGSADRVVVTNTNGLSLSGVSTFTLSDAGGIVAGQVTLIDYAGTALADLSGFSLASAVLGGFQVSLVNNTANTSVDLSIGTINATWNVDANGNWGAAGSWLNNVIPNGIDATANFGTIITAPRTVTVNAAQTVGTLNFSSPISYTVGGGSLLTMDVSSGAAAINVSAGTHTISAPITLNDNLTVTSAASTGVNLTGALTATGQSIVKSGAGSVQFANVRASGLSVNQGVARVSAKTTPNDDAGTSVVSSLTIATGAQLDLTNNSAVIDYSGPVGTLVNDVRQHLQSGRMTSSSGVAGQTGLGYGDNTVLNRTSHGGQTVDADSILIKFTYFGDADLNGQVDVADLGALASNWQTSGPWTSGDFDYSGFVDVADLGLLASNWQAGVGSPLGPSFQEALASVGLGNVAVPEPASIGLIGVLGALSLKRPVRRVRRA